jgi:LysM repeat protein
MSIMRKIRFLLLIAFLALALLPTGSVCSAAPSPDDLIAAVNALRANNGLSAIPIDDILMAAAQTQSDYLAGTCGFTCNGHIGAGGTYASDRAMAAGYSLDAGMNVVECWDGGNSETTLAEVIYEDWADDDHMGVMLHQDAIGVGAGVSESSDGSLYFVLDVAVKYGSGGSGAGVASTIPTIAVTAPVALVKVVTPQADGSIIHTVDTGQALWNIAAAYDVTVDQLLALNGLKAKDYITTGQQIIVQAANTATPTTTATLTPRAPTRTPVPPQTAQAVAAQPEESAGVQKEGLGLDRQTMGLALILICGLGLALVVIGTISKDKKPPKSE